MQRKLLVTASNVAHLSNLKMGCHLLDLQLIHISLEDSRLASINLEYILLTVIDLKNKYLVITFANLACEVFNEAKASNGYLKHKLNPA